MGLCRVNGPGHVRVAKEGFFKGYCVLLLLVRRLILLLRVYLLVIHLLSWSLFDDGFLLAALQTFFRVFHSKFTIDKIRVYIDILLVIILLIIHLGGSTTHHLKGLDVADTDIVSTTDDLFGFTVHFFESF